MEIDSPTMIGNQSIFAECLELLQIATNTPLDQDDKAFLNMTIENQSNCVQRLRSFPSSSQSFVLPLWQQVGWDVVFGAMVITAILGNSIVIWIVLAHRRMRTVTNFFLVNLSVTDLITSVFNTSFNFAFMLNSDWPFGRTYCTFSNFVATLSLAASVFTISAISVDRYIAIVRPLTPRISKTTTVGIISATWICGILLSLPNLLYSDMTVYVYPDGTTRTLCFLRWPDGKSLESDLDYVYNVVILLMTYVMPLSSIVFTYSWMGHVLWKSKGIGEVTETQKSAMKSKQRVARMLTVVALLFAICWLPYHVYFLYSYHNKDLMTSDYVQQVYLALYWLAMSNSMYNPIVYFWMNRKFRNYFQIALCFCCMKNTKEKVRKNLRSSGVSSAMLHRKPGSTLDNACSAVSILHKRQGSKEHRDVPCAV